MDQLLAIAACEDPQAAGMALQTAMFAARIAGQLAPQPEQPLPLECFVAGAISFVDLQVLRGGPLMEAYGGVAAFQDLRERADTVQSDEHDRAIAQILLVAHCFASSISETSSGNAASPRAAIDAMKSAPERFNPVLVTALELALDRPASRAKSHRDACSVRHLRIC